MPSPLLTAATSTFESLALLFADVSPSAAQAAAPLAYAVQVAFSGPCTGTLDVAVSDDVAIALAANMLGFSPATVGADQQLQRDAVGELANVICGNVLPLIAGREAVFHLAAPVPCVVPRSFPEPSAQRLSATLGIELGRAVLTLRVDAPARLHLSDAALAGAAASSSPEAATLLLSPLP